MTPTQQPTCNKAPKGWKCTRDAGHDGPCALVRVGRFSKAFASFGNAVGQFLFGGDR